MKEILFSILRAWFGRPVKDPVPKSGEWFTPSFDFSLDWMGEETSHVCARDTQPGRAVSPVLELDLNSRLHRYSGATPVCATALVLNRQGNPDEPALHGEPYGYRCNR